MDGALSYFGPGGNQHPEVCLGHAPVGNGPILAEICRRFCRLCDCPAGGTLGAGARRDRRILGRAGAPDMQRARGRSGRRPVSAGERSMALPVCSSLHDRLQCACRCAGDRSVCARCGRSRGTVAVRQLRRRQADGSRSADPPRSADDLTYILRDQSDSILATISARSSGMEPPMKSISLAIALAACLFATGALSQQYKVGSIEVDHPWSRATPKGAKIGAGYVSIKNAGSTADRLVGGSFAAAGKVEVHQATMDQGVMKMRPVAGGVEIKPGERVELNPDGLHLMFIDLKEPLKNGEQVAGTLEFEKAGTVPVQYKVGGVGEEVSKPDMKSAPGMKDMR